MPLSSLSPSVVAHADIQGQGAVQAARHFASGVAGKMGYEDFVWV